LEPGQSRDVVQNLVNKRERVLKVPARLVTGTDLVNEYRGVLYVTGEDVVGVNLISKGELVLEFFLDRLSANCRFGSVVLILNQNIDVLNLTS
jgi:hypothetical protein